MKNRSLALVMALEGLIIAVVATSLAASIPLTVTDAASASTSTKTSTYLLYAGHGVGVVATENPQTGCSNAFLTTDFIHWRNITPSVKSPHAFPKGECPDVWSDAYFVSPSDGWLMARNGGNVTTILRHTRDGGKTWIREPGASTGSNGGADTINFTNAALGWRQQFGIGSNGNYALQKTENAGMTWTTRSSDPEGSCVFANDIFSSATLGVASVPWASDDNPTNLWRTANGGVSWSVLTLPPPPSLSSTALGLYGTPQFSGNYGVVPVDYPVGVHQDIYFYVTHDGGENWDLDAATNLPIRVGGTLSINRRIAATQPCTGPVTSGRVAIVTAASPNTWWILQPGPKGATKRIVVTGGGAETTTYTMKGLPSTTNRAQAAALNVNDALITVPGSSGYLTTYETSNGGVRWEKVTLRAGALKKNNAAHNCATAKLRTTPGRSGAAAGHVGMYFYVKNVGTETCALDGYPTLQLMGNSKRLIPTLTTFGSDYAVPAISPQIVLLKPGARAVFMLGYADQTGYGLATCPTADSLRITPPGDHASQTLHAKIQAYGGATISGLVCGEIAVSPMMSLATWKRFN
jgi:photosystem II stability/assembly factor-like uncharacterized protein